MAVVAESHQPIVDAIAAGDVELACQVSREHQAWFVDMLNARADQRGSSDSPRGPGPRAGRPTRVT